MNTVSQNISFTSRCKEIELARKACRKISLYSSTKVEPKARDLASICEDSWLGFPPDYSSKDINNPKKNIQKAYRVLKVYSDCSRRITENKELFAGKRNLEGAQRLLNVVKTTHKGNCGEGAESVAVILNMNGVKNTYVANICDGKRPIDHEICIFNRDGSQFNGKIENNKTIIIDTWSGIIDFANNALKKIKNSCSSALNLNPYNNVSVSTDYLAQYALDKEELNILREQFPEFIFSKK